MRNNQYIRSIIRRIIINYYNFKRGYIGGKVKNLNYYAGNIENNNLTIDNIVFICHYLVMPNGVRKSTERERNNPIINALIKEISRININNIKILDVGSSVGIDALNLYNQIKDKIVIKKYVLGDLYTELLFDKNKTYDEYGNLLQIKTDKYFYNVNYRYFHKARKAINIFGELRSRYYKKKFKFDPSVNYKRCKFILNELKSDQANSVFTTERIDVLRPISQKYDVIMCLNLLKRPYFSEKEIRKGREILLNSLSEKGFLVIGDWLNFEILNNE